MAPPSAACWWLEERATALVETAIARTQTLVNNDVGVYFSNLQSDFSAPATATNDKAVNNTISDDQCFNISYQAGISDVGNNDKMIDNKISGPGYLGCNSGTAIDADTSFTNRPKVDANK